MSKYKQLFDRNIDRVNSLCNVYYKLKSDNIKETKSYKFTAVLRSAVVLLHSSFEEYFRNVLREKLPKVCDENDLKKISFPGSDGKHNDKITLGQMLQYRDLSVEDLIYQGISEELDSTSFNNFSDICNWTNRAKIDISEFNEQKNLQEVISRRHKIVHEADNKHSDSQYSLTAIKESKVREWIATVSKLVEIIEKSIEEE